MVTVSATIKMFLTAVETYEPTAGDVTSSANQLKHDGFDVTETPLNSSSTPAVSKVAYFQQALTAGAATINLTSLTGTFGTVDGTGLKVRGVLFVNPSSHSITVQPGASNPHSCFGSASKFTIPANCAVEFWLNDSDSAIGSSSKNWDLSGTGTDALNVGILLG